MKSLKSQHQGSSAIIIIHLILKRIINIPLRWSLLDITSKIKQFRATLLMQAFKSELRLHGTVFQADTAWESAASCKEAVDFQSAAWFRSRYEIREWWNVSWNFEEGGPLDFIFDNSLLFSSSTCIFYVILPIYKLSSFKISIFILNPLPSSPYIFNMLVP
jgi:hypothetical protein